MVDCCHLPEMRQAAQTGKRLRDNGNEPSSRKVQKVERAHSCLLECDVERIDSRYHSMTSVRSYLCKA